MELCNRTLEALADKVSKAAAWLATPKGEIEPCACCYVLWTATIGAIAGASLTIAILQTIKAVL